MDFDLRRLIHAQHWIVVKIALLNASFIEGQFVIECSSQAEDRSEEHTSELQSPCNLVCRLLLEKKKHIHCSAGSAIFATKILNPPVLEVPTLSTLVFQSQNFYVFIHATYPPSRTRSRNNRTTLSI